VADAHCRSACDTREQIRPDGSRPPGGAGLHRPRAAAEPAVRAWQSFDPAVALAQAERPASGLLHGIAIGLKDLIDTRDWHTGYGSPIYEGHQPDRDGWVVCGAGPGRRAAGQAGHQFGYFQPGPTANPGTRPARPVAPPAARPRRWPPAWCRWPSAPDRRLADPAGLLLRRLASRPPSGATRSMASRAVASLDTLGWMARSANDLELLRAALDQEDFALPALAARACSSAPPTWRRCWMPAAPPPGPKACSAWARPASRWKTPRCPAAGTLFEAQKTIMAWEARSLALNWRRTVTGWAPRWCSCWNTARP
jgi:hypothetical protein